MSARRRNLLIALLVMLPAGAGLCWSFAPAKQPTVFPPPWPAKNAHGDPLLVVFQGRIPCVGVPNCEKVKTAVALYGDRESKTPRTYWLGRVQVGAGDDRLVSEGVVRESRGVKGYPDGLVYELDGHAPEEFRYFWRLNEDILLPLDKDTKPKVGNAAWGYMLSRTN